ncbi:hypothetical protein PRIPAC_78906, partial [Pristionchus pacificus]|uniref:G protein-coupled receptor n=1 Tax=Pristionchus pacificus TaxID=54126 RepID=A0A2A6C3C3_PRIPA
IPEGRQSRMAILPTGLVSPFCMMGSSAVRIFLERYIKSHKDHAHHRSVVRVSEVERMLVPQAIWHFQTLTYQMMLPLGSLFGTTYWFFDMTYQLYAEWAGRMLMMINCSICLASPAINLLCLPPYRRSLTGWKVMRTMSKITER